jgi:hypothetical protein
MLDDRDGRDRPRFTDTVLDTDERLSLIEKRPSASSPRSNC